ncbi:hypothetical protein C479_06741 [Halovivax asiaticus JCM 14624]|uniref:Uncharacterized protein n=1 Tax=Halovivax asiaticus JCM 14624 TaxID=1227490 RepID=M0BL18_9EURY|nr:hypothetical protein [Halovivax asiaticus]ELZ11540.1 hypothetical protein C479_06741 [Halovivax asiaticus JCM 14624]
MPTPRSRRAFLATASLAALAGCLDDGMLDSTDNDETSPARPPGVSDETLDDPEALFSAHEDRLRSGGFELELDMQESASDDGRSSTDYDVTVESGPDGDPLRLSATIEREGTTETIDGWYTGSQSITRYEVSEEPRYEVTERRSDPLSEFVQPGFLFGSFESGAFTVDAADERAGETQTTLVADDLTENANSADDLASATLVADERGVIHRASATLTAPGGSIEYEIGAVGGVDPAEPSWVESVPDSAFDDVAVDVDPITDGEALELESSGDDPVPAGTTVTVDDAEETYRGTIETQLASGERVYLSIQDGALEATSTRPASVDEPFESSISVRVVTSGGVGLANVSMAWGSDGTGAGTGASGDSSNSRHNDES